MVIKIIRRAKRQRVTKQIRVVTDIHEKLLAEATEKQLTLSKMVERICRQYFNNGTR